MSDRPEIDKSRTIPLYIADQAIAAADAEIAKLRDENARLRSFCTRTIIPNIDLETENARLKADVNELADGLKLASEAGIKIADEVTRLKAEFERLTKAGDALCESPYLWETDPAVIEWRAAKEGKQP